MPNLRQIRKRITAVRNTGKITRAMKMVAGAKLRRVQEALGGSREYVARMGEALGALAAKAGPEAHPFLSPRGSGGRRSVDVLLISGDRGLCGSYNTNVIKAAEQLLRELRPNSDASLFTIGRKGRDYFQRRGAGIKRHFAFPLERARYKEAAAAGRELASRFEAGEADEVVIVSTTFASAVRFVVGKPFQLLPIEAPPPRTSGPADAMEPIFDGERAGVIDGFARKYVEAMVLSKLLHAACSEQGARMNAMENATKNTDEMIRRLTLLFNKSRQAAITKELMEIVGGAEAQK